jgi:phosphoribosylanthranilate isomerase
MLEAYDMYVKVCGITSLEDAHAALAAGADALGINLVESSKRYVSPELAENLVQQLAGKTTCVLVVAQRPLPELRALAARMPAARLQLHGDETPETLAALGPLAFKAVRVGSREDIALAERYPCQPLLVDAKVGSELGGTGHTTDWALVAPLAQRRQLLLAGGLTPSNVAEAVRRVHPWGVDVASGVEVGGDPRRKDRAKLASFVAAARSALP